MLHYREKCPSNKNTPNSTLIPGPTDLTAEKDNRSVNGRCIFAIQIHPRKAIFLPFSYASTSFRPTEGVFSHSVLSTEAVFCHSNPLTEATRSLNFAGSSTDQSETQISQGSGSTKPSLSIIDLPLTQEKVESTYADVFQGLGKFPGEPYKLRLKPDAVPAKHRPRKSTCTSTRSIPWGGWMTGEDRCIGNLSQNLQNGLIPL